MATSPVPTPDPTQGGGADPTQAAASAGAGQQGDPNAGAQPQQGAPDPASILDAVADYVMNRVSSQGQQGVPQGGPAAAGAGAGAPPPGASGGPQGQ